MKTMWFLNKFYISSFFRVGISIDKCIKVDVGNVALELCYSCDYFAIPLPFIRCFVEYPSVNLNNFGSRIKHSCLAFLENLFANNFQLFLYPSHFEHASRKCIRS